MHRCSHLLDRNSKCILYNSLFYPSLYYCVEKWGNTLQLLTIYLLLHNRVFSIIIVCDARRLDHTNSFFQQLHVRKLKTLSNFIYRAYYNDLPSHIQRLFTRRNIAYSMRSSYDLERHSVFSTMRSMYLYVKGVQV